MNLQRVYDALNKGTDAQRALLREARFAEPEARHKLVADLERQQKAIKACAAVTQSSAEKIAAHREARKHNPVTYEWEKQQAEAQTAAALEAMQQEHTAIGGIIQKLRALDVGDDILADLHREGIITGNTAPADPAMEALDASIDRRMREHTQKDGE